MGIRRVKVDGVDDDVVIRWLDESGKTVDERTERADALFADEDAGLLRLLGAPDEWPESLRNDAIELIIHDDALCARLLTAERLDALDARHVRIEGPPSRKLRGHSNNSILGEGADPVGGQSNE